MEGRSCDGQVSMKQVYCLTHLWSGHPHLPGAVEVRADASVSPHLRSKRVTWNHPQPQTKRQSQLNALRGTGGSMHGATRKQGASS